MVLRCWRKMVGGMLGWLPCSGVVAEMLGRLRPQPLHFWCRRTDAPYTTHELQIFLTTAPSDQRVHRMQYIEHCMIPTIQGRHVPSESATCTSFVSTGKRTCHKTANHLPATSGFDKLLAM